MQRRLTLVLIMCLAVAGSVWAKSISETDAMAVAKRFLMTRALPSSNLELVSRPLSLNATASGQAAYYVFNNDRRTGGYIIVSGDDRVPAVLGYSDSGTFDVSDVPEAMQDLLDSYAEQIAALDQGGLLATHMAAQPAIRPLMTTLWAQSGPYNALLPMVSSSAHGKVGCVGTAMSQVMYYYKWPQRPTQSIPAYTSSSLSIYMPQLPIVDFEWDLMRDTYITTDTSSAEGLAVARLALYCDQSVEMDFKASSSGATTTRIPLALSTYFGYSAGMHSMRRSNYTTEQWESAIYSELSAARPVIYSGSKASSGHAFVCDGYDGDGRFHINWGWNGQSNGYFVLNVLNPNLQGTGSASGDYGYIYRQAIIVGIQPDDGAANELALTISDLAINSYTSTRSYSSSDFTAVLSAHFNNMTSQIVAADMGFGLYQGDTMLKRLMGSYTTSLKPGSYINYNQREVNFGSGLSSGTYRIVPIYSERSAGNWRPCIGADMNYIEVTIDGNTCTLKGYGTAGTPDYTVNDITVEGHMHPNRPVDVTLNMTNNGDSFNELLYMFVNGTFTATAYVSIERGESDDIFYSYLPTEAGDYTFTFSFNEDGSNPIATRVITINTMPTASLNASLEVLNATNYVINSDKFSFKLTVTNSGSTTYKEDITVKLYKNTYGNYGTNVQTEDRYIELAPGASTTLEFNLSNVYDGWRYFVKTYYYSNGKQESLADAYFHTIVFPETPSYQMGDVDGDNEVSIADVTALINYLLTGDGDHLNLLAADCNDDGELGIGDVTTLINFLLTGIW